MGQSRLRRSRATSRRVYPAWPLSPLPRWDRSAQRCRGHREHCRAGWGWRM